MIAYLSSIDASPGSVATLREELQIGDSFDDATCKKYKGLLEKKWTGIARLQKKVQVPMAVRHGNRDQRATTFIVFLQAAKTPKIGFLDRHRRVRLNRIEALLHTSHSTPSSNHSPLALRIVQSRYRTGNWIRDVSPSFDGKWLAAGGRDQAVTVWEISSAEQKAALLGYENFIECCVFALLASYGHLAALAGLKKPPPASSSSEFIATGGRDKTIRLWDARGRLIKTLVGHDNWVRGLVFHPNGKHLIRVADDKTIRCWDLSQEGRLVKTIDNAHDHFVTCIRCGPSPRNETETTNGTTNMGATKSKFQCVIATGAQIHAYGSLHRLS
ncbi:Nuclear distribution protein nudF 2 [Talaromyces atroroseus]|uniref:Nuclear distribution protein nudF 2 n=1 Tax=Talaromyces atroroseus TaxID=1441469 RepID=A0A225ARD9_TALAT|nr:Nuclear distribution protein nudF 2 [Talaromyces atroroseus]OKL64151.1 Nuclear distribution protein nudF 2 [Talaromyces atroroseus]